MNYVTASKKTSIERKDVGTELEDIMGPACEAQCPEDQ